MRDQKRRYTHRIAIKDLESACEAVSSVSVDNNSNQNLFQYDKYSLTREER